MSFNLATILTETALTSPDARICRIGGSATTYRQLDEQSGRFAAGLRELGLHPGQVVAVQLPNVPQFLTTYFGALKAGLVVLPLNPLLMAPEIEYHLADSRRRCWSGSRACTPRRGRRARWRGFRFTWSAPAAIASPRVRCRMGSWPPARCSAPPR